MKTLHSGSVEFVRAKTLAIKLNCGESTIWRLVQRGLLPPPTVRIGKRCTLWRWADVERHLVNPNDENI